MEWIGRTSDPSSLYSEIDSSAKTYTAVSKRRYELSRRSRRSFRKLQPHPAKMGLGKQLQSGTYRSSSAPLNNGVHYRKDCQNGLVSVQLKGIWNLQKLSGYRHLTVVLIL